MLINNLTGKRKLIIKLDTFNNYLFILIFVFLKKKYKGGRKYGGI